MVSQLTDQEVRRVLAMPKRIGETLRWRKRGDMRPGGRELRATVIPYTMPDFDRDLTLVAEYFRSRSGTDHWSVGMTLSDLRMPLIRIDAHANPHRNQDGSTIFGCMMHLWSEAQLDEHAEPADQIVDCTSVHTALMGFLRYCNIELLREYQMPMEGDAFGHM